MENEAKLRHLELPLLVLHGAADFLVPPQQAHALHAASAGSPKRLELVPGMGHNDLSSSEVYWEALKTFLGEIL